MKNRKLITRIAAVNVAIVAGVLALSACTPAPAADKVSENLSVAAENFEVQRKIVGINGITDTVAFQVEGRCSITTEALRLLVICKHADDDYRKHYVGLSANTFYVAEQLDAIKVSEYHTRVVIRPAAILPTLEFK